MYFVICCKKYMACVFCPMQIDVREDIRPLGLIMRVLALDLQKVKPIFSPCKTASI